ncbi:MAG TPA: hypothetical protein VIQ53_03475 [Inquilinus sp.]|uniref:hypothetical protein n=1 Tax=Inquilinus sp. TaxID=1932117 RepID=UPI002F9AD2C5
MRSILLVSAALLAGACVPQPAKNFVVIETFNESAAGAQSTADRYCGQFGRLALAASRQWNYISFQCVEPANSLVAQTPIPPIWD